MPLYSPFHGGESRNILLLYSDRTGKKIRYYFFNTRFSYDKAQIHVPHGFLY